MGGFIPPDKLEQIRAANDIVELIGSYIPLKRAGANFTALCPFHREKTPSFNVNPQKQIFHCFGCHKGGDVFGFVKEFEGIGFMDAVRRLAERARIPLEFDNQPGQSEARHIKDLLLQIHEQITQRWQTALANDAAGQIARDYLAKRGVGYEAVQLFRLGYAPDLWDDTVNWAKSKHYEMPAMEQAGLIVRKEGSDHFYDRFRGRLIFPICDEQGRVIGFSGRVLSGDEKTAKYVNSPETPIFTKGKIMFGLDKSKRALLDQHQAIICEGQLDLIACFMAGVKNVVAPQGTALTSDHARILERYVDEVILCFDADNAGQNAAVRSLDSLLASGLAVRVATMPPPHDPDSFIKEFGGPAFAEQVGKARGFFDYYLDRLCETNDPSTDRGRGAVARAMSEAVHKTGNDVIIDTYAQKTAMRLGVSSASVRSEFRKGVHAPQMETEEEEEGSFETAAPIPQDERWLLRLLLEHDSYVEWIGAHLELEWLTHPVAREIVATRLHANTGEAGFALSAWLSQLGKPSLESLVTELLSDKRAIPNPEAMIKGEAGRGGVIKILRDKHIDRQLAAINQSLASTDTAEQQKIQLLGQSQELRKLKQQPLTAKAEG